jgi:hypothetical protein
MSGSLVDYKVMVRILTVNTAGPVLRVLARDVLGLGREVDAIGRRFGTWRAGLLAAGAAATGLGLAFAGVELKILRAGDAIIRQQQLLRGVGVTAKEVTEYTDVAVRTATTTLGTTIAGNLRLAGELRTSLIHLQPGEMGQVLPPVARDLSALTAAGYREFGDASATMLKALDLFGAGMVGTQFSPQEFVKSFHALTQVEVLTRGMLTPSALYRIAQTGGFTAQGQVFQQWLAQNLAAMLELGSRAGTGMSQAFLELEGGKVSLRNVAGMMRYGLLQRGGFTGMYGQFALKPGGLYGYEDLTKRGEQYWVEHDLIPRLRQQGITTVEGIIGALSQILGSVRATRLIASQGLPFGFQMTARDRALALQAEGEDIYSSIFDSLEPALGALRKSLVDLVGVVGMPGVNPIAHFINSITESVQGVTAWFYAHPDATRPLIAVLTGLSVGLISLGSMAVLMGLVSLVGPTGLLVALAAGIVALATAFNAFSPQTLSILMGAVTGAAGGAAIGSVIPGVGTAAGALGGAFIGGLAGGLGYQYFDNNAWGKTLPPDIASLARITEQGEGLPPGLLGAIMQYGEGANPAVGKGGSAGWAQLMPDVARRMGVNPLIPGQAVPALGHLMGGYLQHYSKYGNAALAMAIAANNWGPANVDATIAAYGPGAWFMHIPPNVANYVNRTIAGMSTMAAAPGAAATAGSGGSIDVHVKSIDPQAHKNLTNSVSAAQSRDMLANPSGPVPFNEQRNFFPPGIGSTAGVLVR